jgi:hypothetical protein
MESRNSQPFMEAEDPSPCLKESTTGPNPEPDESCLPSLRLPLCYHINYAVLHISEELLFDFCSLQLLTWVGLPHLA